MYTHFNGADTITQTTAQTDNTHTQTQPMMLKHIQTTPHETHEHIRHQTTHKHIAQQKKQRGQQNNNIAIK